MLLPLLLTLTLAAADAPAFSTPTDEPGYLYKVTLVRAAPGKLLDLIALQKDYLARYEARGDASPFWMRHSQGDQWDLLLLFPMESYAAYYHSDRLAHRQALADDEEAFRAAWRSLVAWQEDLFVYGPALDEMQQAFSGASFYHVEMFQALPGITGLWQVSNGRFQRGLEEMVLLDLEYIRRRSILLDLRIMLFTVIRILQEFVRTANRRRRD